MRCGCKKLSLEFRVTSRRLGADLGRGDRMVCSPAQHAAAAAAAAATAAAAAAAAAAGESVRFTCSENRAHGERSTRAFAHRRVHACPGGRRDSTSAYRVSIGLQSKPMDTVVHRGRVQVVWVAGHRGLVLLLGCGGRPPLPGGGLLSRLPRLRPLRHPSGLWALPPLQLGCLDT